MSHADYTPWNVPLLMSPHSEFQASRLPSRALRPDQGLSSLLIALPPADDLPLPLISRFSLLSAVIGYHNRQPSPGTTTTTYDDWANALLIASAIPLAVPAALFQVASLATTDALETFRASIARPSTVDPRGWVLLPIITVVVVVHDGRKQHSKPTQDLLSDINFFSTSPPAYS